MCSVPAAQTLCRRGRGDRTSPASGHKHCKDTEVSYYTLLHPKTSISKVFLPWSQILTIFFRHQANLSAQAHRLLTWLPHGSAQYFWWSSTPLVHYLCKQKKLGMLPCIFVHPNHSNLISDSESSLYMKPILCICVYMCIYAFRTNFRTCTDPKPLHSELEKATVSIINICLDDKPKRKADKYIRRRALRYGQKITITILLSILQFWF